jgi:hypothetical protein
MSDIRQDTQTKTRLADRHRLFKELGLIVHAPEGREIPIQDFEPIQVKGIPVSELIIDERKSR